MRKLVIFNGPPGSGKDTGVRLIQQVLGSRCKHVKMAGTLKKGVHELFGIPFTCEQAERKIDGWKDKPFPPFNGMTPREVYIYMSEEVMKPMFGPDIFGQILLREISAPGYSAADVLTISDAGFEHELVPLVDYIKPQNTIIIHVHRDGCTFDNDSRSYVMPDRVQYARWDNKYDIQEEAPFFRMSLLRHINDFLGTDYE